METKILMKTDSYSNIMSNMNIEKYHGRFIHFDYGALPKMLIKHLKEGPLEFVDLGCGDGPWFNVLSKLGYISRGCPVYAVDLDSNRLERVAKRFPWITIIVGSADSTLEIKDQSIDFIISTMVMEHVINENKYLAEIRRLLRPSGKAYIATVYKRRWAWFYRKRDGEYVLDKSHVREYTDLAAFRQLVTGCDLEILDLKLSLIKIPLLKPLFRIWKRRERTLNLGLRLLLWPKIPVPGYYELEFIVRRIAKGD
jgi:2-polyprenyl-3-methyl-5-hydroxy-6-metoxy-1,4-benzoquinol methylase